MMHTPIDIAEQTLHFGTNIQIILQFIRMSLFIYRVYILHWKFFPNIQTTHCF